MISRLAMLSFSSLRRERTQPAGSTVQRRCPPKTADPVGLGTGSQAHPPIWHKGSNANPSGTENHPDYELLQRKETGIDNRAFEPHCGETLRPKRQCSVPEG